MELHIIYAQLVIILSIAIIICLLLAYVIKRYQIYYIPESAACIVIGFIVGGIIVSCISNLNDTLLTFQSEFFFYLLLPPLIFDASYSLDTTDFFKNFWVIMLYSIVGTAISAVTIGYFLYAIGLMGWIHIDTSSPIEALLFGSLISAIDPVATLSIMGNAELKCDKKLYTVLFSESVLNDAVSIVLFNCFRTYYHTTEVINFESVTLFVINFFGIALGSIEIGVGIGFVCSLLVKYVKINDFPNYEMAFIFVSVFLTYAVSESVELSGIMSVFFFGLVLSLYLRKNLSNEAKVSITSMCKCFGALSESYVYLYIGISAYIIRENKWNGKFIFWCFLACLIGRFMNIYPLSFCVNVFKPAKVTYSMQFVLWFSGLRGAISFAMTSNMPGPHRDAFISATLSIVMITTVVLGGFTEPVLRLTKLRDCSETPNDYDMVLSGHSVASILATSTSMVAQFSNEVISPFFIAEAPPPPPVVRRTRPTPISVNR